jgi:SET domain-containing protein
MRARAATGKNRRRRFVVRRSSIHGCGVFAIMRIRKGARVIEYKGERISHEEADARYGEVQANSPHTMLFAVNDTLVIDATRRGNSARWINHSCEPNCEIADENECIFIEACRNISPGEELTYDYNLQLGEPHTRAAKRAHACFCGARRCRGTMLGDRD